jgi:AcrR family transcriptional regulator
VGLAPDDSNARRGVAGQSTRNVRKRETIQEASVNRQLPEVNADKRAQRTREALLASFFGLVLERRYADIKVADIVARANVGRSTFYEHFANKNAILAVSLEFPFAALADTIRPADNTRQLLWTLQHFWENRVIGKVLFAGTMRRKVTAVLVQMIEQRLEDERLIYPYALIIPGRLAAIQLAENMLAPITAWLASAPACTAEQLARSLRQSTVAILSALRNQIPDQN